MSEIRATKRDPISGTAADMLAAVDAWMRDPRRTQQMQGMADFLGLTPYATTLDRVSYGEPLTTGKGWTLQAKPETVDVALGLLGLAPTTKGLPVGMSIKDVSNAGRLFDLSKALHTPEVAQKAVERYIPKRGAPERVERLLKNRGAFDRAGVWASDGLTDDGLGWYNMEPLRHEFVSRLGEEQGNANFNRYIDLMAATSAGAKTNANARIASYYYVNGMDGQPVPIPPKGSGYGHKAQNLHNTNANQILQGGGLDPIQHPKRFTFAENLKGNWEPVTVDKHNIRAWGMASRDPEWVANKLEYTQVGAPEFWNEAKFGPWEPKSFSPRKHVIENRMKWDDIPPTWFEGAPTKTEYAALERLNQKLSDQLGVPPAAGQAALWLGAGPVTGLGSPPVSMMRTMEEVLLDRAKKRGETPTEVLDQFIRGVRPLAVGGASVGLGYGLLDGGVSPD